VSAVTARRLGRSAGPGHAAVRTDNRRRLLCRQSRGRLSLSCGAVDVGRPGLVARHRIGRCDLDQTDDQQGGQCSAAGCRDPEGSAAPPSTPPDRAVVVTGCAAPVAFRSIAVLR
jgi:hypothetical protein